MEKQVIPFTIVSVNQVIWSTVSNEAIVLKVVGEEKPLTIKSDDGLFSYYFNHLNDFKSKLQEKGLKLV